MLLVKPSFHIVSKEHYWDMLDVVDKAGRTAYKSQYKGEAQSIVQAQEEFVRKLIKSGHESVLEHAHVTVKFTIDRGVSHELVRHRIASYTQESTRYCNYSGGVTFIIPPWVSIRPGNYKNIAEMNRAEFESLPENEQIWFEMMLQCEKWYMRLLKLTWTPQMARSVLPNSLKTEIVSTFNVREWRHVFKLRAIGTSGMPHPQMSEVMLPLLIRFKNVYPAFFGDIGEMK